jgi:hypothetical protein
MLGYVQGFEHKVKSKLNSTATTICLNVYPAGILNLLLYRAQIILPMPQTSLARFM